MSKRVVVLGGYGVFGGRLCARLAKDARFETIVAGRSAEKAAAFCRRHGGVPIARDLSAEDFAASLSALNPFAVVDAAGPFQAYGADPYRVARAALDCGAHYLDLSDDAGFSQRIAALDGTAQAAGLVAASGVSSVPALSSAAVSALATDLRDVHLIETIILPGNRAPRGLSVVRSIVAQAGQAMQLWRGGEWSAASGWSDCIDVDLIAPGVAAVRGRWASLIGAPDLVLFPDAFKARSVIFRAGLDLKILHGGLMLLSLPVRWKWLRSIAALAAPLKAVADCLEGFGSDRGGMRVTVAGVTASNHAVRRTWTLIAEAGDGPNIPAIPAQIMLNRLLAGAAAPGAYPCVKAFSLAEAEAAMADLNIKFGRTETPATPLFQEALAEDFESLPAPIQDLHLLLDRRVWEGRAKITRGQSWLSNLVAACMGFPAASDDLPVRVTMQRQGRIERWDRQFGGAKFHSVISRTPDAAKGIVRERFGPMSFEIALRAEAGCLFYPLRRGWFLGIPMPRFLLPSSETREFIDAEGRACFDVKLRMPFAGDIIRYQGWLSPV